MTWLGKCFARYILDTLANIALINSRLCQLCQLGRVSTTKSAAVKKLIAWFDGIPFAESLQARFSLSDSSVSAAAHGRISLNKSFKMLPNKSPKATTKISENHQNAPCHPCLKMEKAKRLSRIGIEKKYLLENQLNRTSASEDAMSM
jgi:hypothetical protein